MFESSAERRLVSTMGNPINLGLQMCMPIVAALYFAHKKDQGGAIVKKLLCGFSIVLFAWVAIYSYSRTAYVVIIGAVLAFYLIQILFNRGQKKKKIAFLIAIGIAAAVFVIFLLLNENIAARFMNISIEGMLSNPRFSRAYDAFINADANVLSVLFGFGAGSVITESMQYVFEFGYASLLFESGIFGMLIFGYFVIL